MKSAAFALALFVLVGVAATPADADWFGTKHFFDHSDRFSGGSNGGG
jgi:hypothetical protein